MKRLIVGSCFAFLWTIGPTQLASQQELQKLDGPPVTQAEFAGLIKRFLRDFADQHREELTSMGDLLNDELSAAESLISAGIFAANGWENPNSAVTRHQVISAFRRIGESLNPLYARTDFAKEVNRDRLNAPIEGLDDFIYIAENSWLPYESPLLLGERETVSPPEMVVALEQFARSIATRLQDREDGEAETVTGGGPPAGGAP